MENLANWFHVQLTSSADAFTWAIKQVPEERLFIAPPGKLGEWPAARHVFHLLSYERRLALPSMRIWLGETFERNETYKEDVAWENAEWAKSQDLSTMLADFRRIRAEEIALLDQYQEDDWEKTLATPAWDNIPLRWAVTKTLQHTFEHTNNVLQMALFWDAFAKRAKNK